MTEFIYKDYIPANARIIVDYTKEQKVSFSYPRQWTYWKAVWELAYPTITKFWITFNLLPIFFLLMYGAILVIPIAIIISLFFPFSYTTTQQATTTTTYIDFNHFFLPIGISVFYFLGIPAIVTFLLARDKNKLSEWLPKMGYWTKKLEGCICETTFTDKDISDNKCIIPSFSNVFLEYNATGEFSDYLEKIEILEIPFHYKMMSLLNPFKSEKVINDYEFRAVFYFSKTPKAGFLKVEFI